MKPELVLFGIMLVIMIVVEIGLIAHLIYQAVTHDRKAMRVAGWAILVFAIGEFLIFFARRQ